MNTHTNKEEEVAPTESGGEIVYLQDKVEDPLENPRIIKMLRRFYECGPPTVFPPSLTCEWNTKLKSVPHGRAQMLGLCPPVRAIRAPSTEHTVQLEKHATWRPGVRRSREPSYQPTGYLGYRIADMVVGCWLSNTACHTTLLADHLPKEYRISMLQDLISIGFVRVDVDGNIYPKRALLYRQIESIAWLLDTLSPMVASFYDEPFADKFKAWPGIGKEVLPCSS